MMEKVLEINKEKTIFWSILASLLLSIGFYIFFINQTVHNTVARQNIESEIATITLKIGSKEFDYISKRNSVTISLAYEKGFKEAKVTEYVSRKAPGVAFLSR